MSKYYRLHSVRIEDEVWAQVKASGLSVNQLLLRGLRQETVDMDGSDAEVEASELKIEYD